jgi:hypothetical protein
MHKISKKAQIGSMMSSVVATIAIALIILLFALASTLFTGKLRIEQSASDFSKTMQSEESSLSLLQSINDNMNVADMIRLSKNNFTQKSITEDLITASFNKISSKWNFIVVSDIPEIQIGSGGTYSNIRIPDFNINKQIEFGIK